jgi:hypothetical protein
MKKLRDLPEGIRAMLWTHEAFRKLGFTPDEIVPSVAIDGHVGGLAVFMEIVQGGAPVFTYTVVPCWGSPEEVVTEWKAACVLWNRAPEKETREVWMHAKSLLDFQLLALAIDAKGVKMPAYEATKN